MSGRSIRRDVVIRPEAEPDYAEIRRVVAAAFGQDLEAVLVERIRSSPTYVAELALVAELEGAVVGHVMVSMATLRTDDGDRPIAMLSPLAVDPPVQGSGIGGALVRAVTGRAEQRGETFVVLEGSPVYYGRLGFRPAADFGVQLPVPSWAPPEAGQLLPLRGFDPDDSSLRGHVIYPPPFDGLE